MLLHDTREKDDELCMNRTVSCMRIGRITWGPIEASCSTPDA